MLESEITKPDQPITGRIDAKSDLQLSHTQAMDMVITALMARGFTIDEIAQLYCAFEQGSITQTELAKVRKALKKSQYDQAQQTAIIAACRNSRINWLKSLAMMTKAADGAYLQESVIDYFARMGANTRFFTDTPYGLSLGAPGLVVMVILSIIAHTGLSEAWLERHGYTGVLEFVHFIKAHREELRDGLSGIKNTAKSVETSGAIVTGFQQHSWHSQFSLVPSHHTFSIAHSFGHSPLSWAMLGLTAAIGVYYSAELIRYRRARDNRQQDVYKYQAQINKMKMGLKKPVPHDDRASCLNKKKEKLAKLIKKRPQPLTRAYCTWMLWRAVVDGVIDGIYLGNCVLNVIQGSAMIGGVFFGLSVATSGWFLVGMAALCAVILAMSVLLKVWNELSEQRSYDSTQRAYEVELKRSIEQLNHDLVEFNGENPDNALSLMTVPAELMESDPQAAHIPDEKCKLMHKGLRFFRRGVNDFKNNDSAGRASEQTVGVATEKIEHSRWFASGNMFFAGLGAGADILHYRCEKRIKQKVKAKYVERQAHNLSTPPTVADKYREHSVVSR